MPDSNDHDADLTMQLEASGILNRGLIEPGHENLNPANMLRTVYYWENKRQKERSDAYRKLLVIRWPLSDEAFIVAEELGDELNGEWAETALKEIAKIADCREWYQTSHKALIRKVIRLEIIFIGIIVLYAMAMKALDLLDGTLFKPLLLITVLVINVPLMMLMYEKCPNCQKGVHEAPGFWGQVNNPAWVTGFPDRCPHCKCRLNKTS